MNASPITEVLLSVADVAKAIGMEPFEVPNLHPDYFGVPGHWRLNKQTAIIYTDKGVEGLIDVLEMKGKAVEAHSLRVTLQQEKDKPSRRLVPTTEKPHWQNRADLA